MSYNSRVIGIVISNRLRTTRSANLKLLARYSLNFTPLSPITITYDHDYDLIMMMINYYYLKSENIEYILKAILNWPLYLIVGNFYQNSKTGQMVTVTHYC